MADTFRDLLDRYGEARIAHQAAFDAYQAAGNDDANWIGEPVVLDARAADVDKAGEVVDAAEAAILAEIERLRAENARLKEAVRRFAGVLTALREGSEAGLLQLDAEVARTIKDHATSAARSLLPGEPR